MNKGEEEKVGLWRWSTVSDGLSLNKDAMSVLQVSISFCFLRGVRRSIRRRARTGLVNGMWWILQERDPLSRLDESEKMKCHYLRKITLPRERLRLILHISNRDVFFLSFFQSIFYFQFYFLKKSKQIHLQRKNESEGKTEQLDLSDTVNPAPCPAQVEHKGQWMRQEHNSGSRATCLLLSPLPKNGCRKRAAAGVVAAAVN